MNEKCKDIEGEVTYLRGQIGKLIKLLGFCGYEAGFIDDNDKDIGIVTDDYIGLNKERLPVKSKDFNLLLDYLGVEISPERKTERKIVKKKGRNKANKEL